MQGAELKPEVDNTDDRQLPVIRETDNYTVTKTGVHSVAIVAKVKDRAGKNMLRLYLRNSWDRNIWRALQSMSNREFDGSCALELGI